MQNPENIVVKLQQSSINRAEKKPWLGAKKLLASFLKSCLNRDLVKINTRFSLFLLTPLHSRRHKACSALPQNPRPYVIHILHSRRLY